MFIRILVYGSDWLHVGTEELREGVTGKIGVAEIKLKRAGPIVTRGIAEKPSKETSRYFCK